MLARNVALLLVTLSCSIVSAQLYETAETRKLKAESQLRADDLKKKEAAQQPVKPSLQQKEAQAKEYLGKVFWFLPNPSARDRIRFYERIPVSSHSLDPNYLFTPLVATSFVVTGLVMAPPVIFPAGTDEYLLEIKFPDNKVGYVNVVGCCGLKQNLYMGKRDPAKEYVSTEPAEDIFARENAVKEKADLEERLARERAERESHAAIEKAAKVERERLMQQQRAEQARRDARAAQLAKPSPRIGMTKDQVINQTNWGRPYDINRTTTAAGTREQWVYGIGHYLYFEGSILKAIQD